MQMMTYKAIIRNVTRNMNEETMYNGFLPNSSLNDDVTRGTRANPSVYTLRPVTACRYVQLRSRIMDVNPIGYVDATVARGKRHSL
jgi:hypothetical protein